MRSGFPLGDGRSAKASGRSLGSQPPEELMGRFVRCRVRVIGAPGSKDRKR